MARPEYRSAARPATTTRQSWTVVPIQASALGTQIDDLFELRSLITKSQDAERKVTGQ